MSYGPPPPPPPTPAATSWWRSPVALFLIGILIAAAIAVPIVLIVLGGDDDTSAASSITRPVTTTSSGSSTTASSTKPRRRARPVLSHDLFHYHLVDHDHDRPAEEVNWSLDPNFGEDSLSTGFLPDPYAVAVISGGNIDASYLMEQDCRGYATAAPDFHLFWDGAGGLLRFFFVADTPGEDTVLIVNGPAGGWFCNDDYLAGVDPMLDFPSASEGTYDIWVASYNEGENVAGMLYITESPANTP